ncbi:hypothetical protein LCGC14_3089200 [marine sediment metagenome]|uniref:Uncharacterized protein n=1 Tax=marine sediment metagenome TaxID=412755 RepID=A0A0F8WZQ6_9ZZZZ
MECINCGKENEGRSQYCDNTCKTQYHRNHGRTHIEPVRTVSEGTVSVDEYETVSDAKCYGRQAVKCAEFGTRPEPLDHTDQPVPLNRGRYQRTDGTVYMFDAIGQSFECVNGNVYQTVEDVRQAAAERVA